MGETRLTYDGKQKHSHDPAAQNYMRAEVERMAAAPDRSELFERIRRHVESHGITVDTEALLSDLESDRR